MGLLNDLTDAVGLTDTQAAKDAMDKSTGITKEQMDRISNIDLPDEEKMRLLLENPELVGLLEAQTIDPSKLGEISLDPQLREKQMAALQDLQSRADEGLTATDKYQMEQLLGQAAGQQRSQLAGIESDMARRGMDSSGAALMAKLQAGQTGANSARDKAMQMAAQGQQNRMNALAQIGNQAGNMEQKDFSRQAQVASAQDAISRANAMNRQNVAGQNLAARQGIENQRAGISNEQQRYNKGLEQNNFNNKIAKEQAMSGASANLANSYAGQASAQAGADANAIGTAMKLGGAYFTGGASLAAKDGGIMSNKYQDGGLPIEAMPVQDQQRQTENEYKMKEKKQHETFKKKYMKRIQEEIMGSSPKPKTPVKPEGKTGYGGRNTYEDGGLLKEYSMPSEVTEEGTDYKSPDDRTGSVMAALLAEMKNMNPENNIPMRREDGGTMYASEGEGDIVDSGMESYAGDRVDAKINDGEAVINVPQQQRFMDLVRGKIGVDELGDDDIVEGVPRSYSDDMHERLSMESEQENDEEEDEVKIKMNGLEKLLEMLGEE